MEPRQKRLWRMALICGLGLIVAAGCAKRVETVQTTEIPPTPPKEEAAPPPAPQEAPPPAPPAPAPAATLGDVFFDFDQALIRQDDRARLNEDAQWLKEHGTARMTIEGHCDERGTDEYNLALGERRAKAAKRYLEALGIESGRIETVSYGEERPFCTDHSEQCWQQNRRGHVIEASSGGGG
ncbi:MAG TPA: peptidoglycan-associated lipoprotein Pal [Nitrospiria bacterium]|nr:peptidoglycan-associated lipoprotein Pal [Nitrospiria bacterium]